MVKCRSVGGLVFVSVYPLGVMRVANCDSMLRRMQTERVGDRARYYAMVMAMADHIPITAASEGMRAEALYRLVQAVQNDVAARGDNRDRSAGASTRVRAW